MLYQADILIKVFKNIRLVSFFFSFLVFIEISGAFINKELLRTLSRSVKKSLSQLESEFSISSDTDIVLRVKLIN